MYRAKTNLIEGRAEAGHAKASPRVKYPKLAIKTRKKRRNLIFCCESANIWLSRGSVCLCALSPLCPPFYLSPVDKYGKAVRLLKPVSTLVGRLCRIDVTVRPRVNAGHILFFSETVKKQHPSTSIIMSFLFDIRKSIQRQFDTTSSQTQKYF